LADISGIQKDDPPGGTTGRVGYDTGVDEAPVPDAGFTMRAFSSEVDPGSREENASNRKSRAFSSEVDPGPREENASNRKPGSADHQ
jgi:hypothetical protein